MTPHYADEHLSVYLGDCLEVMPTLADASVDAVVTDPPYGLEFMGKEWDRLGDIGQTSHGGIPDRDGSTVFGRTRVSYSGSSNRKCRTCAKWEWDYPERKCVCDAPDFPNAKAHQSRIMQAWHERWAREAFRLLRPGGYLLAFGGTRTYHRLASAIEDAGFEIRDCLVWAYASGFPKSLDVGKAIDRVRDDGVAIREVTAFVAGARKSARVTNDEIDAAFGFNGMAGHWTTQAPQAAIPKWDQWLQLKELLHFGDEMDAEVWRLNGRKGKPGEAWDQREKVGSERSGPAVIAFARGGSTEFDVTAPATDDAKRWDGWGTALKPAWEPIVMARKPLQGTVAANVLRHGVGALNIDGTRIGFAGDEGSPAARRRESATPIHYEEEGRWKDRRSPETYHADRPGEQLGRWPANVVLTADEEGRGIFDGDTPGVVGGGAQTSGYLSPEHNRNVNTGNGVTHGEMGPIPNESYGDTGTYSRFFLIPKEARSGREPAVRGQLEQRSAAEITNRKEGSAGLQHPRAMVTSARENVHPTVKPLELMRHLVRLVTPPGGMVLDCFLGSGTTALAAINEGFRCIGIEREAEYMAITMARLHGTQIGMGLDAELRGRRDIGKQRGNKDKHGNPTLSTKRRAPHTSEGWGFTTGTESEE